MNVIEQMLARLQRGGFFNKTAVYGGTCLRDAGALHIGSPPYLWDLSEKLVYA
jgi:hypothetical protein